MASRYTYAKDLEPDTIELISRQGSYNSRLPFRILQIAPSAFSPDGTDWLQCVDAVKSKVAPNVHIIRLRVVTNTHRGVNINIRCDSEAMYLKYLDLRHQIRNSATVLVTFPEIYVTASIQGHGELYLRANDFKLFNTRNENSAIEPTIHI